MTNDDFKQTQQALATAWKKRTPALWPEARVPAPWVNQRGESVGEYPHCLAREYAKQNLLPGAEGAVALFHELNIPWHCGIDDGPGNNLLSSQVQCVNALMPMLDDPARIISAFGNHIDIAEALPLVSEPDRYLTFEYIGPTDYFGEGAGKPRRRGTRCTSVDAAFRYRTSSGTIELALVEWKYTEQYDRKRKPNPGYDKTRVARYGADYHDPAGPLRSELLDIEWMLDEPFYQLLRQQLLASRLEQERAEDADVVRVLHVLPPANTAYQHSLVRPEHRALGTSVDEVWSRLLRRPDRFRHVDPAVFVDPEITSWDYVDRYSPSGTGDLPWGVSVWRHQSRISAATFCHDSGIEWCGTDPFVDAAPTMADLAALPDREYFDIADDERTLLVGPREYARAFLRAVVATGLHGPADIINWSSPGGTSSIVATWPPLDRIVRPHL